MQTVLSSLIQELTAALSGTRRRLIGYRAKIKSGKRQSDTASGQTMTNPAAKAPSKAASCRTGNASTKASASTHSCH